MKDHVAARPSRRRATVAIAALVLSVTAIATPVGAEPAASESRVVAPASTDRPQVAPPAQPLGNPTGATIALSQRASGLFEPVFITTAGDGTDRLFIVQQNGVIKILKNGSILPTPFLNISGQVNRGSEEGLLGLAFHPRYETNGRFFVYLTNRSGNNVVREYRVSSSNPNVAVVGSKRLVLTIPHPVNSNHNGGMIAFGAGSKLFIGTGDGGGSGDPNRHGQSVNTLLGKILRIDVDRPSKGRAYGIPSGNPYIGKPGLNEIWQIGLRNPWRWSLDRATGDMWIGDVGQNQWEEVDRATHTANGPGRGINWGWRSMEGNHCYQPSSGCSTSGKTRPITEYGHGGGHCAVTGGYVYRGSAIPMLVGGYVFADYCTGEIWVVNATAPQGTSPTLLLDTNALISSFGENAAGELYVTDHSGKVWQIVQG
jgi:glucose/arabinose dehydrogenase